MMISPGAYIGSLEGRSYPELIKERKELIRFINRFEKNEMASDRSDPGWEFRPSPEVKYQVYLEYLSQICDLMRTKYNEKYIFGNRTLKEDADETEQL